MVGRLGQLKLPVIWRGAGITPPTSAIAESAIYKLVCEASMAAMGTSRVFVKRPREAGRVELCVEDVQQLSVERLKEKVAEILDISMEEFRKSL